MDDLLDLLARVYAAYCKAEWQEGECLEEVMSDVLFALDDARAEKARRYTMEKLEADREGIELRRVDDRERRRKEGEGTA